MLALLIERDAEVVVYSYVPHGYGFASEVTCMALHAYFAARNTLSVFVFIIFINPSVSSSQNTRPEAMPALAKKMSSRL
jgi:hypothetical protein